MTVAGQVELTAFLVPNLDKIVCSMPSSNQLLLKAIYRWVFSIVLPSQKDSRKTAITYGSEQGRPMRD